MLIFDRDKFDLSKPLVRLETEISVKFWILWPLLETVWSLWLHIQKIDANMDPDCQDSYDSFLRTQVFNNNDSNLIKNLSRHGFLWVTLRRAPHSETLTIRFGSYHMDHMIWSISYHMVHIFFPFILTSK